VENPILFFDGLCHLCDGTVQFLLRFDKHAVLKFAPLQSKLAERVLGQKVTQGKTPETVVLYFQGRIFERSTAILKTFSLLGGPWKIFSLFLFLPPSIRDWAYRVISRNRYRWFGKHDVCLFSKAGYEDRFLQ
jgi:predicted DCC family thiol-disulfide oxidoreductase YuxK